MLQKQRNWKDLFVVLFIVSIAGILGLIGVFDWIRPYTAFSFTLVYFGLPSLYLLFRKPENVKSGIMSGLTIGLLCGLPFDFSATYANAWVFNPEFLRFPHSIFGVAHLDEVLWFFFWAAFASIFYEHFFEHDKHWHVSRHIKYLLLLGLGANILVFSVFFIAPQMLLIDYSYLILGTIALLPLCLALFLHPRLLKKIVGLSLFFIPVYFLFEYIALSHGWWIFSGHYVGGLEVAREYLPLEELFFWIIFGAATVAAYHELFLDDGK